MKFNSTQMKFFKELYDLCNKYNVFIDGCGCCGSPTVDFLDSDFKVKDEEYFSYLEVGKGKFKIHSEDITEELKCQELQAE